WPNVELAVRPGYGLAGRRNLRFEHKPGRPRISSLWRRLRLLEPNVGELSGDFALRVASIRCRAGWSRRPGIFGDHALGRPTGPPHMAFATAVCPSTVVVGRLLHAAHLEPIVSHAPGPQTGPEPDWLAATIFMGQPAQQVGLVPVDCHRRMRPGWRLTINLALGRPVRSGAIVDS